MDSLLIKGGTPVSLKSVTHRRDIRVCDGVITEMDSELAPKPGEIIIDATNALVAPGGVDLAVCFREPGREWEERASETMRQAARGGFTTVAALPSGNPVIDNDTAILQRRLLKNHSVTVSPIGALTKACAGERLAEMGAMARNGAVAFSDYPFFSHDPFLLRCAFEYARSFDSLVIVGGACPRLLGGAAVNESAISSWLGVRGSPAAAEVAQVALYVELARLTGAKVHVVDVSCGGSVELIRRAIDDGVHVSASTTPWHLLFDETIWSARPFDTAYCFSPPLRSIDDRAALVTAVKSGHLAISSQHRALSPLFKECEFEHAEPGALSLATCVAALCGGITLSCGRTFQSELTTAEVISAISQKPSEIMGLKDRGRLEIGLRADLMILRSSHSDVVSMQTMGSRVSNTPLLGATLGADVCATICQGDVVYDREKWSHQKVCR